MIVGITGHRSIGDSGTRAYAYVCYELIKILDELKPEKLLSGMALGSDMAACDVCIKLGIPYIACLPFVGQELLWSAADKSRYTELLAIAASIEVICEGGFANWKYQKRNEYIVDNSDMMIGIWDGSKSGTKNCLDYAQKQGKKIIIIDPKLANQ
jgi:uncharacterized phage-like protein YoqJ